MKPLVLKMTAFGPYAGTEIIDFRPLGEAAFFLIHGPTGAGKTTILDAMCFSLFGVTSGSERDGKQMRSDYVDPSVATEVVFDFALGGEIYRVRRSPEQKVLKKRGEGTTTLPSSATLWRRTGSQDDDAEGSVVASRWEKVTEAMESLLGFRYAQFRQVVMLPQGEFRRLLLASSKEREGILETLFQTELYRRIEEFLKLSAKELETGVHDLTRQRDFLLQEAGVSEPQELADKLATEETRLAGLTVGMEAAREELGKCQTALTAARLLKEQFTARRESEELLTKLAARQPEMETKRQELAKASQAALLAEVVRQVEARRKEVADAKTKATAAAEQLATAASARQAVEVAFNAELAKDQERDAAAQTVMRLSALQEKVKDLELARQTASKAQHEVLGGAESAAANQNKLQQTTVNLEGLKTKREQLLSQSLQLPVYETGAREAHQLVEFRGKLDALRQEYQAVAKSHAVMQQETTALVEAVDQSRTELESLELHWRQGWAAEMAQNLKSGEPCPVCGSPHHPAPATGGGDTPSSALLESKRQELRRLEKELEAKREQLAVIADQKKDKENDGKTLRQLLGDKAECKLDELRAAAAAAEANLKVARQAAQDQAVCETAIAELEATRRQLETETAAAEAKLTDLKANAQSAAAILAEREAAVPAALREQGRLEAEIKQAELVRDKLNRALETAREAMQNAVRSVDGLAAAEKAAGETLATALARVAEAEAQFEQRLLAAGFGSRTEFDQAVRPEAVIAELAQVIKDYETAVVLAKDRAERADRATQGLAEPDVAAAEAAVDQAQVACDELIAVQATLKESIKRSQELLGRLAEVAKQLAGKEEEYAILGKLAEVANGQNPLRMSFHRFVLSALLDDVMQAANTRLKKMSRGRYALRRMIDPLHRGAAGGLDIEIDDSYTGVSRHVATLSGGETFLASLALALGLTDVVQGYAGGIHLDTIFVDEGFGTLDPESLDMAVQALVEIQGRGRLVGIISHVPELKERIEARLEIIATERGSTTRWSLQPGAASPGRLQTS